MPCRASPPQGGRSDVTLAFANHRRRRKAPPAEMPISPLAGEMSGRTEGGASRPPIQPTPTAPGRA
ncbi:MAG: hypothetical protein E5X74_18040 [Mesorhizobium sp.]|nr:MAG: hypothetical protein E5X75_20605 [Mesorhizobium sp.]TIO84009.1 MAG: hypothetical protein E5X74_18040 [Mesorhizobium sp.]